MSDPDRVAVRPVGPHSSGLLGSANEAGLPGPSQMNCSQVDLGKLPNIVKLQV